MRSNFGIWTVVASMILVSAGIAHGADWEPVIQIGDNVREIDKSSIVRTPPTATYLTRHVFASLDEYLVGRRGVKYLVIKGKADCDKRTTFRLAVDAYDEKMALISKQNILQPEETAVTPESIEEAVLNYVCKSRR